jgi:hypothetical protein
MKNENYTFKDFYSENYENFKKHYLVNKNYYISEWGFDGQLNDELNVKEILGAIYNLKVKHLDYDTIDGIKENEKIEIEAGIIKAIKNFSQIENIKETDWKNLEEYCNVNRYENTVSYWLGLAFVQIRKIVLDLEIRNLGEKKELIEQLHTQHIISEKQKGNLLKHLVEKEAELKIAESKIIKTKGYEPLELVDYYINCMHKAKAKPSVRDLEKGSDYNKDKWNTKILKDFEFVIFLNTKLQKLLDNNIYKNLKYVSETAHDIEILFADLYQKHKDRSNMSNALAYDEEFIDGLTIDGESIGIKKSVPRNE